MPADTDPSPGTRAANGASVGGVFLSAVVALVGLALSVSFATFVSTALAREDWVGWTAVSLLAVALVAGLVWGYLRARDRHRPVLHAVLQGLEWFVAYGGAAALVEGARFLADRADDLASDRREDTELPERITHIRQVVTERTGTEG